MTSPVLFSTGTSPTASGSRNLVEFKAGKMEMRDKMVHPIKRQGLVYLRQSPDDNLMHFYWKDRQTGIVEDDLILFPDDCEFKRVKECTTGRVFVLKMKSSNKNMFFWMQESRSDKDDEYCKKINDTLNNPPRAGSDLSSGSSERDLSALFGNMTQEQVAQLLSSNGVNLANLLSSTTGRSPPSNSGGLASSTASTTNSSGPTSATSASGPTSASSRRHSNKNCDLQALLSSVLYEGNEEEAQSLMEASMLSQQASSGGLSSSTGASSSSHHQAESSGQPLIDLSTAVNSDSLAYLLNNEDFLKCIEPHLPPVSQHSGDSSSAQTLSPDERRRQFGETVRTSQFRSSLSQFCVALQSGQLGPLMTQFGLNQACVDAANLGNLEAFVRALDAQTAAATSTSTGASSETGTDKAQGGSQGDSKDKK